MPSLKRSAVPDWRPADPRVRGSVRRLAEQKRALERRLRADGWSKAAAVAEVARRFAKDMAL